jgi:D-alanyl-D-alanine carboxypeptidase-like protein
MANYMKGQHGGPGENLAKIRTAGERDLTVNAAGAPNFKGFVEELEAQGAPLGDIGSYNKRRIRGGSGWSQHAYGNAIDVGDQSGMNEISPAMKKWHDEHPKEWRGALNKWGMESGEDWHSRPDLGHVEWTGKAPPPAESASAVTGPKLDSKEYWEQGRVKPSTEVAKAGASGGPLTADAGGRVDPVATYSRAVEMFRNSPLNGYVPADGATWGISKGTPEEWARLAVATTKQESDFNIGSTGPHGENSYGITQMARGEYGIKNPLDPDQAMQGLVNQWSQYIPASGSIAGRGSGPGTSGATKGQRPTLVRFDDPTKRGSTCGRWVRVGRIRLPRKRQVRLQPRSHEYWDITKAKGPARQTEVAKAEHQRSLRFLRSATEVFSHASSSLRSA